MIEKGFEECFLCPQCTHIDAVNVTLHECNCPNCKAVVTAVAGRASVVAGRDVFGSTLIPWRRG